MTRTTKTEPTIIDLGRNAEGKHSYPLHRQAEQILARGGEWATVELDAPLLLPTNQSIPKGEVVRLTSLGRALTPAEAHAMLVRARKECDRRFWITAGKYEPALPPGIIEVDDLEGLEG